MKEDIKKWLKSGNQSKITKTIKNISNKFSGNDLEKIQSILSWMERNLKRCKDQNKVLKIFATRNVSKVLKDGFSTGCHDDALVFVTLCRAVGIPAKYVAGIDKLNPENKGHCVVEVYINKNWILVDQSRSIIALCPRRSNFYKENFIVGKGYDSWDIGIKSFKTWKEKSNKIIKKINKIISKI